MSPYSLFPKRKMSTDWVRLRGRQNIRREGRRTKLTVVHREFFAHRIESNVIINSHATQKGTDASPAKEARGRRAQEKRRREKSARSEARRRRAQAAGRARDEAESGGRALQRCREGQTQAGRARLHALRPEPLQSHPKAGGEVQRRPRLEAVHLPRRPHQHQRPQADQRVDVQFPRDQ